MLAASLPLGSDLATIYAHSDSLDREFGLDVVSIEQTLFQRAQDLDPNGSLQTWGRSLHGGSQTWVGLLHHTLLTPWHELDQMLDILGPGPNHHFVDLGAGYGRMGLLLHQRLPAAYFTGIELVGERVEEGNRAFVRHDCGRARLVQGDLFDPRFTLPLGDTYMIYDYGNIEHIRWTMGQLQNLATIHRFKVVARGKGVRSLIQYAHPWLSDMGDPVHEEHFSVYSNYEV